MNPKTADNFPVVVGMTGFTISYDNIIREHKVKEISESGKRVTYDVPDDQGYVGARLTGFWANKENVKLPVFPAYKAELHNAQYLMNLGCGIDYWMLSGIVYGHPDIDDGKQIFVSTPIAIDETNNILTTYSGRKYKIVSYASRKETVIEQIKKDIEKGGYEKH